MLLKADVKDNPYNGTFEMWLQDIATIYPSSMGENGRPTRKSKTTNRAILNRLTYAKVWREIHGDNLIPQSVMMRKVDTTDQKQTSNLWALVEIIDKINAIVTVEGRNAGEYHTSELAKGIRRSLGETQKKKTSQSKTLFNELKARDRWLQAFSIALQPPADFDPDNPIDGQIPYKINQDENVSSLVSKLNRSDITTFEKIFHARGGDYTKGEQHAYKMNFDSPETDAKERRLWLKIRIQLGNPAVPIENLQGVAQQVQPVEYYTLDFQKREEPLFNAIMYIFNKFGRGKSGERFFSKEKQKAIKRKIKERKRDVRGRLSPSGELRGAEGHKKQRLKEARAAEKARKAKEREEKKKDRSAMSLTQALLQGATINPKTNEIVWPDEEE